MSEFSAPGALAPVISDTWDAPRPWTLAAYRASGGYEGLAKAWGYGPGELTQLVKDSGLVGRGGAGFPTGLKWSFLPPPDGGPPLPRGQRRRVRAGHLQGRPRAHGQSARPHRRHGDLPARRRRQPRLRLPARRGRPRLPAPPRGGPRAREAGLIGKGCGPRGDYDIDITVHAGAGAYICGEETALLDSLEGRRGQPRLKPPFPAAEGLYARPTVINNVETISSVPGIVRNGVEWFQAMGTETSKGHVFYSLSGHISRPGQYEAPIGITGRSLMDLAGGVREGHSLKFWGVGGSSAPLFTPEQLDVPLDYAGVRGAGSMLATRAVMVFDETVSVVRVISRWTDFYQHESCGKCTPCREGTYWMRQIMHRLEAGRGRPGDVDLLYEIAGNIAGRSFCALGDAAATPIRSGIELFRDEFEAGCTTPARELFPYEKTTLFGEVAVR